MGSSPLSPPGGNTNPPDDHNEDKPKTKKELLRLLETSRRKRKDAAQRLKDATEAALSYTPDEGTTVPIDEAEAKEESGELPPLKEAVERAHAKRRIGVSKLKRSVEKAVGGLTTFWDKQMIGEEGGLPPIP